MAEAALAATILALTLAALWLVHRFWPVVRPSTGLRLIAHRGVHQWNGPGRPAHDHLENTIPSMRAAFEAGADVVEIDLHLTRDGQLAVFHDDVLENRTDGEGRVEERTMAELSALDIGYRISPDRGRTFPFRGKGRGLMPSLPEVMEALPEGRFMLDLKRGDPALGQVVVRMLRAQPDWRTRVWGVYGEESAVAEVAQELPDVRAFTRASIDRALRDWMLFAWSGWMPAACRGATIYVPLNYSWALWGWPHRFTSRIEAAGGTVVLMGPYRRDEEDIRGIDNQAQATRVPDGFSGYVQTDRIKVIGPLLKPPGAPGTGDRPG